MTCLRFLLPFLISASLPAATYYVDCAGGNDANAGTARSSPWRTLEQVNGRVFAPGDSVVLRRGTKCSGILWPKGSGEEGEPIGIGSYGSGPLPLIEAGPAQEAAVKLFNQQHWHIESIETSGGNPYGILISGDNGVLRHFRIKNVVARDVGGEVTTKLSGLIAVIAGDGQGFEDILIDGATAYNTTQWAGIIVRGGSPEIRARNVTVRNSIVHDVYGDGIVLFQVENGVIEKSAAWLTGLQPVETIGTPNAIWTWRCRNCVVQHTEGFFIDSPGVDGAVYDIDWGNDDNIIQFNFGHDAQGYCASVFAANGETTTNSIVRYNVCVNNGRSPKLAKRQGDIFLSTWEQGALDGVLIHNNTLYWNPPIDAPALQMDHADFTGSRPNVFRNNLIYSTVPSMVHSSSALKMDRNLYWHTGIAPPKWSYGGATYEGFERYRRGTGQDAGGLYADPRLTPVLRLWPGSPAIDRGTSASPMPDRDAFGVLIPTGKAFDIGASEFADAAAQVEESAPAFSLSTPEGAPVRLEEFRGQWILLSFLEPDSALSRTQVVFLQSALWQYGEKGLEVMVASAAPEAQLANLRHDWNLGRIKLLMDASKRTWSAYRAEQIPATILISPQGKILRRWAGFVSAAELGLTLRWLMGPPAGSPAVNVDGE